MTAVGDGAVGLRPADLCGRRAVVLGLGRFGGGVGAVRHLVRSGARVVATDLRTADQLPEAVAALEGSGAELVLGAHRDADLDRAELVVANPAVPPGAPALVRARRAGARITSEIELFLAAAPCDAIGVTGTQGKSSTTSFAAQLLERAGRRARAGGNLGGSLLDALDELGPKDLVVLELSSYQLEGLGRPPALARPLRAVCVTNVLADHLERHGSVEAYAAAKRRVLELGGDGTTVVLPAGGGPTAEWSGHRVVRFDPSPCADDLLVELAGRTRRVPGPGALGLPAFQAANLRAALALADALGAGEAAADALAAGLVPPPHRSEPCGRLRGAVVLDNGVSTTPDSTAAALEALTGPVVLVAGGRAKSLPLRPLVEAARGRVRRAVLFGESAALLAAALAEAGVAAQVRGSVEDAVEAAARDLGEGDTLLFSPACASFDTHANFKERALAFRAALEGLAGASEEGRRSVSS